MLFFFWRIRMCSYALFHGHGWQWSYYVGNVDCWVNFYEDDYSPALAVIEDLAAGF